MRGSTYKRCPHGQTGTPGTPACKLKHGTWWWRADGDPDINTGKRKQASQGGYPSRDDAQEGLTAHLNAVAKGEGSNDKNLTVKGWLIDWLEECEKQLAPKTYNGYYSHAHLVLIPHLGHRRLRELRHHHIEKMIRTLRDSEPEKRTPQIKPVRCNGENKDGTPCKSFAIRGQEACRRHGGVNQHIRKQGRGGRAVETLSRATLDSYRRTLRTALSAAKRRGLIATNPAAGIIDAMPRRGAKKATTWWQPDDVARFLLATASDPDAALYELAGFGGLRRGELGGLAWADVDLTSETPGLWITQTLSELAGPQPCPACSSTHIGRQLKVDSETTTGAKSHAGHRWVPLVGGTVRELIAHKAAQEAERDRWGDGKKGAYKDHGLVFPMENGIPRSPSGITKKFDKLSKDLGLPKIRLHDMRHGAASLLIAAGTPIETVAMLLGHASTAVTREVYAHILKAPASDAMRAAMALVREEAA